VKRCVLKNKQDGVLDKGKTMDNVQKHNICTGVLNVYIPLRISLMLPGVVAAEERSFLKLKLLKNHLRSSMRQAKIISLVHISRENEIFDELAFDDIVNEFAIVKSRKVKDKKVELSQYLTY
jgi:hypothetical protein